MNKKLSGILIFIILITCSCGDKKSQSELLSEYVGADSLVLPSSYSISIEDLYIGVLAPEKNQSSNHSTKRVFVNIERNDEYLSMYFNDVDLLKDDIKWLIQQVKECLIAQNSAEIEYDVLFDARVGDFNNIIYQSSEDKLYIPLDYEKYRTLFNEFNAADVRSVIAQYDDGFDTLAKMGLIEPLSAGLFDRGNYSLTNEQIRTSTITFTIVNPEEASVY